MLLGPCPKSVGWAPPTTIARVQTTDLGSERTLRPLAQLATAESCVCSETQQALTNSLQGVSGHAEGQRHRPNTLIPGDLGQSAKSRFMACWHLVRNMLPPKRARQVGLPDSNFLSFEHSLTGTEMDVAWSHVGRDDLFSARVDLYLFLRAASKPWLRLAPVPTPAAVSQRGSLRCLAATRWMATRHDIQL